MSPLAGTPAAVELMDNGLLVGVGPLWVTLGLWAPLGVTKRVSSLENRCRDSTTVSQVNNSVRVMHLILVELEHYL